MDDGLDDAQLGGHDVVDDGLDEVVAQALGGDLVVVLRGDDDRPHGDRLAVARTRP